MSFKYVLSLCENTKNIIFIGVQADVLILFRQFGLLSKVQCKSKQNQWNVYQTLPAQQSQF